MGRPATTINLAEVEKLAHLQCTCEEFAGWFGVSKRTWIKHAKRREVSEAIERGRERGKCSLRRAQLQTALKGNPALLIWLGKQMLGQTHRMGHAGKPIELDVSARELLLSRIAGLATRVNRMTSNMSPRAQAAGRQRRDIYDDAIRRAVPVPKALRDKVDARRLAAPIGHRHPEHHGRLCAGPSGIGAGRCRRRIVHS